MKFPKNMPKISNTKNGHIFIYKKYCNSFTNITFVFASHKTSRGKLPRTEPIPKPKTGTEAKLRFAPEEKPE